MDAMTEIFPLSRVALKANWCLIQRLQSMKKRTKPIIKFLLVATCIIHPNTIKYEWPLVRMSSTGTAKPACSGMQSTWQPPTTLRPGTKRLPELLSQAETPGPSGWRERPWDGGALPGALSLVLCPQCPDAARARAEPCIPSSFQYLCPAAKPFICTKIQYLLLPLYTGKALV